MALPKEINPERIPRHVAIVMDGNGRWAKSKNKPRLFGHKAGAESVRDIVETACDYGVEVLTLYAFSSENWKRPEKEVSGLMSILQNFLGSELKKMLQNGIKLSCIGEMERLPKNVRDSLQESLRKTADNDRLTLNLALSYGSRDEITRAVQIIGAKCRSGELDPSSVNHEVIANHLYTADLPDPDLLIRTGGEERLSNFLLWQASYSEIYFTDVMWPEFRRDEFTKAIIDFQGRERRFGKTTAQVLAG